MTEGLKEIPGFEDYFINRDGEVFSKKYGDLRKASEANKYGYCLFNNRGRNYIKKAKLLGITYGDTSLYKKDVKVIDGNGTTKARTNVFSYGRDDKGLSIKLYDGGETRIPLTHIHKIYINGELRFKDNVAITSKNKKLITN